MGTDIHPVVQVRGEDGWQLADIPADDERGYGNLLSGRDYRAFAILGDVRNGYGFAGVVTGSGFVPISRERGVPEDFGAELDEDGYLRCPRHSGRALPAAQADQPEPGAVLAVVDDEDEDDEEAIWNCDDCIWLGDHSWTYVTLRELQDYDWDATTALAGVITGDEYLLWFKGDAFDKMPSSYAGGISGRGLIQIGEDEFLPKLRADVLSAPLESYVVAFARRYTVRDAVPTLSGPAIEWLASLGEPDDVRIVMGFDS